MSDDEKVDAIKGLLGEFTTYPTDGRDFSILDHMFLDFEFWPRLIDILESSTPDPKET